MSTEEAPGQDTMTTPSLRSIISGLRSALTSDGPSRGRLQLSLSAQPSPIAGAASGGTNDSSQAAGATAGAPQEEQQLVNGSGSSVLLPQSTAASAVLNRGSSGAGAASSRDTERSNTTSDVAAAAEHHRLTSLSSSVDLRAFAVALERGLPYATLLLFLFISAHIVGIAVYAYLSLVLFRLNALIRAQVALKQDRQAPALLVAGAVAALHVPLVLLAMRGQDVAGNLVLEGSRRPAKFWEVVFAVVVGDTLLRYMAVLAKVCVLLTMRVSSPALIRRRGHVLTAVEYCSEVYRMLPPAPLWYNFFTQAAIGGILQTGLSGAYLLVKAQHVFERAALAALALRQVAVRGYGSTPSAEEIQEAGNMCPICQDCYRDPVRLCCGHIHCSACLDEWFERERTCPMCRASVGPANKKFKSAADGRTPLLPVIF